MIVIACSVAASVSAAVFLAIKSASKMPVKISALPATRTDRAKEMNELGAALIKELDRIQENGNKNPADVRHVVKDLQSIVKSSWDLSTFYGKRGPSSFLEILNSSSQLYAESPSKDYIELIKSTIEDITPTCTSMVLCGEDGSKITDVANKGNNQFEKASDRLDQHMQSKLRETFNEKTKEAPKW